MRNIPHQKEYFAVLIDFEDEDFAELSTKFVPHAEYTEVSNISETLRLSEKELSMISSDLTFEWPVDLIASNLFMTASTLRRKLKNDCKNQLKSKKLKYI
ncbi:hypothetical protein [Acinetobacter sp. AG3]|jgi:hypothetical protein|uniref:hypothetical protein n=1 Tax=unclassified Acinetobacter TaxID=196816 RepID=UPI001EEFA22F|nr:hypothetical protein [Acinetobacter sp. AG3]MCG7220796.1 hypothetical protein [Acinetobacter sp. AG3]